MPTSKMLSLPSISLLLLLSVQWSTALKPFCEQPPNLQRCRAAIPSWFYNATSENCEEFVYGGCPDAEKENRFNTRFACIRECGQDAVCNQPAQIGRCRGAFPRWYYNMEHRRCEEFTFGGCDGNNNNFLRKEECERSCGGAFLPCELGQDFEEIGTQAVHDHYRQKEWFTHSCASKCKNLCLEDKEWGYCLAYSVRKRWYGCNCYLYDQYLSSLSFDPDTSGSTNNRLCVEDFEPTL